MFIPLTEQPRFQCSACGECCSHIRGFIPSEDRKFIEEFAFGKLPVVQLVPVERMTFPLWDWEAKRFEGWSDEIGKDARIKPLRAILDLNSNTAIIMSYFMESVGDACPLLENKKCSIYHTKRAYVCRLFPFNKSPFSFSGKAVPSQLFGECGAMEKLLPALPEELKELIPFLEHAFPDGSFLNAVQNDLIIEWANRIIIDLMKAKKIRPAMNLPYAELLERVDRARKIDFTDFLVECGHLQREEMDALIGRFDENSEAKEKIAPFLPATFK